MAQSFLVFNFGDNEELAQQARHKVDGWKQGFRLDKKLLLKFDRSETGVDTEEAVSTEAAQQSAKEPSKKADEGAKNEKTSENQKKEKIQLIIRLDFSDHERLSQQRWLERIPSEAPFKDAQPKIIRHNDADFAGTSERFDSLP